MAHKSLSLAEELLAVDGWWEESRKGCICSSGKPYFSEHMDSTNFTQCVIKIKEEDMKFQEVHGVGDCEKGEEVQRKGGRMQKHCFHVGNR